MAIVTATATLKTSVVFVEVQELLMANVIATETLKTSVEFVEVQELLKANVIATETLKITAASVAETILHVEEKYMVVLSLLLVTMIQLPQYTMALVISPVVTH